MKKQYRITAVAFITIAALTTSNFLTAAPATAESEEQLVEELMLLAPDISKEQLLDNLFATTAVTGKASDAILRQYIEEAEASLKSAKEYSEQFIEPASSGPNKIKLTKGARKGDIFVTAATTLGIDHGHTGIYYSDDVVVEAPGLGLNSRKIKVSKVKVTKGTVKQYVNTSQANRNAAADYAYNYMQGKPYNMNFFNNRGVPATHYNCSQLVWGAYYITSGLDLDSDGGSGVYPYNIKDSYATYVYEVM